MREAIWLISGGPMQYLAARKIREMGYALVLSDRNENAFCRTLADWFLQIDTFDVDAHLAASEDARRRFSIRAVLTAGADCHYTVSRLACHLGLPHISPEISEKCRNKSAARELLRAAGLPQPASQLISTYEAARQFLSETTGAFVIKATDNSGSRGFSVIDSGKQLTREQFDYARRMGTTGSVILEERLEADSDQISEASVETVWCQGKMYWINWVDRIFPRDLQFFSEIDISRSLNEAIEIGHINPATHNMQVKDQVRDQIEKAGLALGMHQEQGAHILKADIFFSTRGPVILELTPRTSGGWDSGASSPVRGADIVGGVIHLALGKPLDLNIWYRHFHYHDSERTAVVLSRIPDDAVDCIGRQFALASGYGPVGSLIKEANYKLDKGEYIVPV